MDSERVKILSAKYDKFRKLVIWKIQTLKDNQVKVVAFRSSDIGPAVGINKVIPEDAIIKFCNMLTNKEVNWVSQVDDTLLSEEEKKEVLEDSKKETANEKLMDKIDAKRKNLEAYPFEEVEQYAKSKLKRR